MKNEVYDFYGVATGAIKELWSDVDVPKEDRIRNLQALRSEIGILIEVSDNRFYEAYEKWYKDNNKRGAYSDSILEYVAEQHTELAALAKRLEKSALT